MSRYVSGMLNRPSTYETAQNNITLIDASLLMVLKLQSRIKIAYEEKDTDQILIYEEKRALSYRADRFLQSGSLS